jgi:hypothetical protein
MIENEQSYLNGLATDTKFPILCVAKIIVFRSGTSEMSGEK